uniref:Uncharacterized protein n=1 Tax=Anopheles coluzzii TaxID=1518534 RepID=A0A8W7Q210_ANOCL
MEALAHAHRATGATVQGEPNAYGARPRVRVAAKHTLAPSAPLLPPLGHWERRGTPRTAWRKREDDNRDDQDRTGRTDDGQSVCQTAMHSLFRRRIGSTMKMYDRHTVGPHGQLSRTERD